MKARISYAFLLISVLTLFSCGPKRPSTNQVDAFMESLSLRMNMAKDSYTRFVNTLPEKNDMMSGTMVKTVRELVVKNMKEERELINKCKTFEADESAKTKSEALKQAAIDVIDTYINGADNELKEIETLVSQGRTGHSAEVQDLLTKFDARIDTKYKAYGQVQEGLAKEFNISLY